MRFSNFEIRACDYLIIDALLSKCDYFGFSCAVCLPVCLSVCVCVCVHCPQIELWKLPTALKKIFLMQDYADFSVLPKRKTLQDNVWPKKSKNRNSALHAMWLFIRPAVALVFRRTDIKKTL